MENALCHKHQTPPCYVISYAQLTEVQCLKDQHLMLFKGVLSCAIK